MAVRSKAKTTTTPAEKKARRTRNKQIDAKAGKKTTGTSGRKRRTGWKHTPASIAKIKKGMKLYWKNHPFAKLRRKMGVKTKMPVEKTLRYVRQKEREARKAERAKKREARMKMRDDLRAARKQLKSTTDGRKKRSLQSQIDKLLSALAASSAPRKKKSTPRKTGSKAPRRPLLTKKAA